MTLEVDYIPFATGGGAVVQSQANYVSDAPDGVVPGLADPTFANKAWRQGSMIAAAVANFISAQLGINVLDDGNLTNLISELTAAIQLGGASGIALGMGVPQNLQLQATAAANQLTIAVVGTNGSVPSSSNPVVIPFRDPTIANGEIVPASVTAALSIVIADGSTMGVANNNQPFRLWVVAFNNGGTVAVAAINCSILGQIFPLNEDSPQNSQAGTTGGNSAGVFYASTASIAAKSIRILGYVDYGAGLPAVGVWSAGPTKVQLFGPGQHKPGEVVQSIYSTTSTQAVGTPNATKVNLSGFSPAPTLSPTTTVNQVRVRLSGSLSCGAGHAGYAQLFRATNAAPIGGLSPVCSTTTSATPIQVPLYCEVLDNPATLSSTTYGAFVESASSSDTTFLNTLGSIPAGSGLLVIEEIMG